MTTSNSPNIRKAAVLIRSLDAETAARLLAQLPPAEANAVRAAVTALGPIDPDEQADVAAEMRRSVPMAGHEASSGVELMLSMPTPSSNDETLEKSVLAGIEAYDARSTAEVRSAVEPRPTGGRFEFLEQAPITTLVRYLAREHVQTIAVVLSYLSPSRAAAVLAALPSRQQADTLQRLSVLGETDADSVKVVEQELAAWVSDQSTRRRNGRSSGAASAILAAADAATRERILTNLKAHKGHLADQFGAPASSKPAPPPAKPTYTKRPAPPAKRLGTQIDGLRNSRAALEDSHSWHAPRHREVVPPTDPLADRMQFDDLVHLDAATLSDVLREVDPNVLLLALTDSTEEMVERIAVQMPRRTAKAFRKRLRRLGPTRLSDVVGAQRVVARAAARHRLMAVGAAS
jgi:flagellar motor switch protein FliG